MSHELSITRHIAAPPETVWKVYTTRKDEFFCPKPWRAEVVEEDFRAGGRTALKMFGPDGEVNEMEGVFLEVVPNRKLVTTDALTSEWQPQGPFMIAITTFEPEDGGTRYTATARHWSEETMQQHRDMGFEGGWGAVADQLAEIAEQEARQ